LICPYKDLRKVYHLPKFFGIFLPGIILPFRPFIYLFIFLILLRNFRYIYTKYTILSIVYLV
jgi:hypothetical protein